MIAISLLIVGLSELGRRWAERRIEGRTSASVDVSSADTLATT